MKSPARVMMNPARSYCRTLSRILFISVYLLLIAGCESGSDSSQTPSTAPAPPGSQANASVEPGRPSGMDRSGSGDVARPDGTLDIEISDAGVTIRANQVSEQEILYTLAARAGFELIDAGVPWQVVTLNLQAENLHTALVELLKPRPYQIIYEFDSKRQADTLKRVVAGDTPAGRQGTLSASAAGAGVASGTPDYRPRDAEEETLSAEDQVNLTLLLDPSPDVREEAAEDIEPIGAALDYLTRIVTTDPSPEVRIAAIHTLEDSEDPRARDALIAALQDQDIGVLEEAIDMLGYAGNRSTIPYLQPFLNHPDEDIRDAAETSINQLE